MQRRFLRSFALALAAFAFALAGLPSIGQAQQLAGVHIDPQGVLHLKVFDDPTGELNRQHMAAGQAMLNPQVAAKSPLRKISLNRLEKAVAAAVANGGRPSDEMRYLAGLTRLKYVFFYPETKDIVIAGPAEGWGEDLSGRVCSISSGRPVLELQDLIVALRAYPPHGNSLNVIGCSIDPTPEGLARMQDFLRQLGGQATPDDTDMIVNGLRTSLGLQKISVLGVPADTHFAQVMVEADYRMKLIGIGLEEPPIKMASYVDRASPASVSRNALARWFFMPDYQCVRTSKDGLAMELVGDGVKLVGENEMVSGDGARHHSGAIDKASQMFVTTFTKKYPQLAERSPVYAQLRDLIDMSVAAAFIQKHEYYGKAEWKMDLFGDEEKFAVHTCPAPIEVETAVASVWKGNQLMTPVGGGVTVYPRQALESANLLPDEDGQVQAARANVRLELAPGQWWWD